mgnify:CR=1 FL=1
MEEPCNQCGEEMDCDPSWTCLACHEENQANSLAALARQARTIRRLRALADGYRARAERNGREAGNNCETCTGTGIYIGTQEERARIVAALGKSVCTGSLYPPEVHAAVHAIRDAIERGEL